MAKVDLNEKKIIEILDEAMRPGVDYLVTEIEKLIPRDIKRLPNPIPFKGVRKDKPYRSSQFKPRLIGGQWYEGVSGELKRSVKMNKNGPLDYEIGVEQGTTEKYAWAQEFGSKKRNIPERSFLRLGKKKGKNEALKKMQEKLNILLGQ